MFTIKKKYQIIYISFISLGVLCLPSSLSAEEEDPTFRETKAKEGYILNLKDLIKKSKRKIEKVNDKIKDQAKLRRNEQREEKAREYFEKANRLFEEGKIEEAAELWEKAIKITEHPEMEGYVSQSVKKQKKREKAFGKAEERRIKRLEQERGFSAKEVEKRYSEGVAFYKKKNYLAAKAEFDLVDEMFPDHKATRSYLALIDRKIDQDQEEIIKEKLKKEAFLKNTDKEAWHKELERKEKERRDNLEKQADEAYVEAIRLYKTKQFTKAKERFKEVEWILPDYKKTLKYLSRIDGDIAKHGVTFSDEDKVKFFKKQLKTEKKILSEEENQKAKIEWHKKRGDTERLEDEAEFVYDSAVSLYKKKYYAQSLEKFYEVQELIPNYKKTEKYLVKIRKKVPNSEAQIASSIRRSDEKYQKFMSEIGDGDIDPAVANQAEGKYQEAIAFYNTGNTVEAQRKFIAVEAIAPGYKATRDYLQHIDSGYQIPKEGFNSKSNISKSLPSTKLTVKERYKIAERLYKSKNYKKAKEEFLQVQNLSPNYKGTQKFLNKIDKKLSYEEKERQKYQEEEIVRDEEREMKKAQDKEESTMDRLKSLVSRSKPKVENQKKEMVEDTAKEVYYEEDIEPLTRKDKKKVKEAQKESKKILKKVSKEEQERIDNIIGDVYKEAKQLYGDQRYIEAKAKFATVNTLNPGYRRAKHYMGKIDEKIAEGKSGLTKKITELKTEEKKYKMRKEAERIVETQAFDIKDQYPLTMSSEAYQDMVSGDQEKEKNARNQARMERLQRLEEEELARLEERAEFRRIKDEEVSELKERKKEEKKVEKRIEKEAQQAKEKAQEEKNKLEARHKKQIQKELEGIRKEAMRLYRESDTSRAKDLMFKYEETLAKGNFTESYRIKMRNNLSREKLKIQELLEAQRREAEQISYQKVDQTDEDKRKLEIKRERTLEDLERKIKQQEREIAKEREQEDKRLQKSKRRELKLSQEVEAQKYASKYQSNGKELSKSQRRRMEKQKKKELEKLVKLRQKELQHQRIKVQQEFDNNIEDLYNKAVALHKKGYNDRASRLFSEIQQLQPGYRKTEKYISKLGGRSYSRNDYFSDSLQNYTSNGQSVRTEPKHKGRVSAIKNALDSFEEKLW